MDAAIVGLHTAARRYLEERHAHWVRVYAGMSAPRGPREHSDAELATFPRYQVLDAIRVAVEVFVPADFATLAEARERLVEVGASAQSVFTHPMLGATERRVMEEERAQYQAFVRSRTPESLASVAPLPYRRTLLEAEQQALRDQLRRRWQVDGHWYPLAGPAPAAAHRVVEARAFLAQADLELLRARMAEHGVAQVFELRELHPTDASLELELELFEPTYNGSEGFWFDRDGAWLVYASHEDTITWVGGWLVAAAEQAWPEVVRGPC